MKTWDLFTDLSWIRCLQLKSFRILRLKLKKIPIKFFNHDEKSFGKAPFQLQFKVPVTEPSDEFISGVVGHIAVDSACSAIAGIH
jgi:hypothetical protein